MRVVCIAILVVALLVGIALLYRHRKLIQCDDQRQNSQQQQQQQPLGVSVAMFPLRNWATINKMMYWKSEMSNLDGLIKEIDPVIPDGRTKRRQREEEEEEAMRRMMLSVDDDDDYHHQPGKRRRHRNPDNADP